MRRACRISQRKGVALEVSIVDRSDRQNAGRRTRSRDCTGIHNTEIIGIDAKQRSAGAVVACRHAAEHTVIGRTLECRLEIRHVVIEARRAAERQIHDVRPQLDGVLDRADNIIRECAVAHAEHLKVKNLRIGRNTRDAGIATVAGCNAGDMQAMSVGVVIPFIVAGIAVGKRNLVRIISTVAKLLNQGLGVVLRNADLSAVGKLHIGVMIVDAAVEHSNHRTLAGIAHFLPHLIDRGHVGRIVHLHLKGRDRRNRLNAGKFRDLRHLSRRHIH